LDETWPTPAMMMMMMMMMITPILSSDNIFF
jgi:hypothetical protein